VLLKALNVMEKTAYIKIQNSGEIDIKAFTLFGASTKRGDGEKIGYFGSGLKYSMAVLLRNDVKFRIFSGLDEIKVSSVRKKFRNGYFNVIKINNKETNYTVEMGPDWEAWFAIREIYCNALDEGEASIGVTDKEEKEIGKTTVLVEISDPIKQIFSNWSRYFTNRRDDLFGSIDIGESYENGIAYRLRNSFTKLFEPLEVKNDVTVGEKEDIKTSRVDEYTGKECIIYRRGVQCGVYKQPSVFSYDCSWVEINESRIIKSDWEFKYYLAKVLGACKSERVITRILDHIGIAPKSTFEFDLDWSYCNYFSDAWLSAIGDRALVQAEIAGHFVDEMKREKHIILPQKMVLQLRMQFGDKVKIIGQGRKGYTKIEITPSIKNDIDNAVQVLKVVGYKVNKYDIEVGAFETEYTEGIADTDHNRIVLSHKLFDDSGKERNKRILRVMLEEYFHLESGEDDKTREFEDFILNEMTGKLMEMIKLKAKLQSDIIMERE
jgi:hypothetical protein